MDSIGLLSSLCVCLFFLFLTFAERQRWFKCLKRCCFAIFSLFCSITSARWVLVMCKTSKNIERDTHKKLCVKESAAMSFMRFESTWLNGRFVQAQTMMKQMKEIIFNVCIVNFSSLCSEDSHNKDFFFFYQKFIVHVCVRVQRPSNTCIHIITMCYIHFIHLPSYANSPIDFHQMTNMCLFQLRLGIRGNVRTPLKMYMWYRCFFQWTCLKFLVSFNLLFAS